MAKEILWAMGIPILFLVWMGMDVSGQENQERASYIKERIQKMKEMLKRYEAAKTDQEQDRLDEETGTLWNEIATEKELGAKLLQEELAIEKENHHFLVNASALLYKIEGEKAFPTIITALSRADLAKAQTTEEFFHLGHLLARLQKPEVLPVLDKFLPNKDRTVFISRHFQRLSPQKMLTFTYGVFGRSAAKHLVEVLQKSTDIQVQKSALSLLSVFRYDAALPAIRQLAQEEATNRDLRIKAINCLGMMGDPKDTELFEKLLKDKDPKFRFIALSALYELDSPETVPLIVPMLSDVDGEVRTEAVSCLYSLAVPSGIESLVTYLPKEKEAKILGTIKKQLTWLSENGGSDLDSFLNGTPQEREGVILKAQKNRRQKYLLKSEDRKLSHDDFVKALQEWKQRHTIGGGTFKWVEERHVLDVAKPQDLDLLFEVRSSVLWRISDEALHEIEVLDDLIQRIHRFQYKE